jgi:hypothetical protein
MEKDKIKKLVINIVEEYIEKNIKSIIEKTQNEAVYIDKFDKIATQIIEQLLLVSYGLLYNDDCLETWKIKLLELCDDAVNEKFIFTSKTEQKEAKKEILKKVLYENWDALDPWRIETSWDLVSYHKLAKAPINNEIIERYKVLLSEIIDIIALSDYSELRNYILNLKN